MAAGPRRRSPDDDSPDSRDNGIAGAKDQGDTSHKSGQQQTYDYVVKQAMHG